MKPLKEYLTEGILDIEDNLDKDYIKIQIEDFIKDNYGCGKLGTNDDYNYNYLFDDSDRLQIIKLKDKYIVNFDY